MYISFKHIISTITNDPQLVYKLIYRRKYLISIGLSSDEASKQTLNEYNY